MEDIRDILHRSDGDESTLSKSLRSRAEELLESASDIKHNSSIFEDLLVRIIKPLFANTQHPAITATGRKVLVPPAPSLPNRFGDDSIFDAPPLWKNSWTIPLISWILASHETLPPTTKKVTVEANFHLLIPPLLQLIDDAEIQYKVHGCNCLQRLCTMLKTTSSDILKRTGLAEVFIDALKNCFHYLPTLTPEDGSLALLKALYPAYLALVDARFVVLDSITSHHDTKEDDNDDDEIITITLHNPSKPPTPSLIPTQITIETQKRNANLTLLLRHSLLYTLSHLNTTPSTLSSTTSPPLTIYLITQIPLILRPMHIHANTHLQTLIPLLTHTLYDPFATAAPELLIATVQTLEEVVCICWMRIRERWWGDVLRGCVGVWCNVSDDLEVISGAESGVNSERKEELEEILVRVKGLLGTLGDVMGTGEEKGKFVDGLKRLVLEEPLLEGMVRDIEDGLVVEENVKGE